MIKKKCDFFSTKMFYFITTTFSPSGAVSRFKLAQLLLVGGVKAGNLLQAVGGHLGVLQLLDEG